MNYRNSLYGPVAIIPATALRNNRTLLGQSERSESWRRNTGTGTRTEDIPINLAYYLSPPRRTISTPLPLPPPSAAITPKRPEYDMYSYYPSSPYLVPPSPRVYRTRSYTTASIFNEPINGRLGPVHVKAVSGPVKYPEPLYKKRTYLRSRSADWITSGGSIRGWTTAPSTAPPPLPIMDSPMRSLGRRPYYHNYPASYVTYPPSTFYGRDEKESLSGNVYTRLALKIAQLVVGAIVIGTVAGPAQGETFSTFTARTQTGGQVYVLVIACIAFIMTIALLTTIYFASRSRMWKNVDGTFSACTAILYLVAGCVEAWYANCYPPYGIWHPEVCRLVSWAICAIFAFINMVLYTIDFVLAAQAGIDF